MARLKYTVVKYTHVKNHNTRKFREKWYAHCALQSSTKQKIGVIKFDILIWMTQKYIFVGMSQSSQKYRILPVHELGNIFWHKILQNFY